LVSLGNNSTFIILNLQGKKSKNSLFEILSGFKHSLRGISLAIISENNLRIHIVAALIVMVISYIVKLNMLEWAVMILCIGLVIGMELINTAIEYLADAFTSEYNEEIKNVKDVAAGAVLISAITSIVVAGLILLPKLFDY
jgi:diacylglycerol kinase